MPISEPKPTNGQSPRRGFLVRSFALLGSALIAGTGKLLAFPKEQKVNPDEAAALSLLPDEPFIGEIIVWPISFAPRNWAFCYGQILPINTNQALFSLLGTTYGGNGQTTFALPDLRGRMPIHVGNGHTLGEWGGMQAHTLTTAQTPSHTHPVKGGTTAGSPSTPGGNGLAVSAEGIRQYGDTYEQTMASSSAGSIGGSQAHNNMPPFLAINYIIALQGIYPSRN